MGRTRFSVNSTRRVYRGKRRFEHWYRDNQVYFITSKCRGGVPAFDTEAAKTIFWDRMEHYAGAYGFTPWITSLVDNHYHTLGYLKRGEHLATFMQRWHGSVARLVNDLLLASGRGKLAPFWRSKGRQNYFDGCIRDARQCRRAYRYVQRQAVRHGLADDWRAYPHTRGPIELEKGVRRALQLGAFLTDVPYARYDEPDRR